MTISRATKTLTLNPGEQIQKDSYISNDNPTTNFGSGSTLLVGAAPVAGGMLIFITVGLPAAPSDCDQTQNYGGIAAIRLKLYLVSTSGTPANPSNHSVVKVTPTATWTELGITYNNAPAVAEVISAAIAIDTTTGQYKSFPITNFRQLFRWGAGPLDMEIVVDSLPAAGKYFTFASREGASNQQPTIEIDYLQKPPAQISDLKLVPDANDETRPVLTWTFSKDELFSKYQVFRKIGAGAYAQVGSDITVQGQSTYVDTAGGLTENSVIYYKIREVNVDGSYNESNEVWLIRPDVSTFTVDDTTPDVNQKITATIAAVAYGTTPTPVTNTDYYYEWGSGSEYDQGSALVKDLTRTHIWPAAGSQTPKCQIKNSQGFRSDKTSLTSGGPTLTVASIAPVAKLKAAPMVQLTNTDVRFYGDESYAPAVNKTINVANGYEWDQDYVAGPFVADFTTTLPYKDVQWASAGTKRLALRVKDQDGTYSPVVTIDLDIIASVVVNLDNLVDGFDVLDHDEARQTFAYEGVDATEIAQAGKRIHSVTIGGFAFTDANADNVPDDVATLKDVIDNLKKVQLTVLNVVRTGMLRSGLKVHTEGGWALKYNWTVDIALDP